MAITPGTIVRCRNREWVVLSSDDEAYLLRPLAGTTDDAIAVHKRLADLIGYELPEERVVVSSFPPPFPQDVSDAASVNLLWQAARLTLREGAAPFRSLGKISIRPRVYQLVPLLMAFRLDPVRLFIADDVGVGKTIEALLVARELFDRGQIKRFAVLCPPYLCDQWVSELQQKFNLEPTLIRSGTISTLERYKQPDKSIYEVFPIQVLSIDWVKTDRNKHQFLQFCPELVIVDEVHGAAQASSTNRSQQERHQLLREIAKDPNRHLILLTATPHSGIEEAFRSLLSLLRPEFREWNITDLDEKKRVELAHHFVQRTRADIEKDWEGEHCFPKRETSDEHYQLSEPYRRLFDKTFKFCSEIVQTGKRLEKRKQRVRYWGALALLRCVMSSPAAAVTALEKRIAGEFAEESENEEEPEYSPFIVESDADRTDDETPNPPIEAAEATLPDSDRRRLRELAALAKDISTSDQDTKIKKCTEIVRKLIAQGFHPIIWCRYVTTAEYVGNHLRQALPEDVQVVTITGRMGDDERRVKIDEIDPERKRVLVATDCLSEGINLQDKFTAVLHYDLPWNPNRLEQREGRVDRYGQTAKLVKAIRFYGRDNPVDGVVIDVLLKKAYEIHQALGTHVPVPQESESVMEAVLNALFIRGRGADGSQLQLDLGVPEVAEFHRRWERDAERERINRTRFAQRALKPEEVKRELEATDKVLGDPNAVRDFLLEALQRLGLTIEPDRRNPKIFRISIPPDTLASLPDVIRFALPESLGDSKSKTSRSSTRPTTWSISFDSPTPEGAEYIGRNHRFVSALARYLLEQALETTPTKAQLKAQLKTQPKSQRPDDKIVSRCGVIRTLSVDFPTTLLLIRVRYLIHQPEKQPILSEEVVVTGYKKATENGTKIGNQSGKAQPQRSGHKNQWLTEEESLRLLSQAKPDQNVPLEEKRKIISEALEEIGKWESEMGLNYKSSKHESERSHPDGFDAWLNGHPVKQAVGKFIIERAKSLEESHKRIRQAVHLRVREFSVKPQFPPDLLGLLVLEPVVKR